MIYLDNSATTKPYHTVLETYRTVADKYFGNPSSIHKLGGEVDRLIGQSRANCALLLGVRPHEIVFTSGGTEGNNLAIKGIAFKHQGRGKHIITSSVEHAATYEACKQLEEFGFDVTFLPVDQAGLISLTELKKSIRDDTILVSILHVNNETGTIQPIAEIATLLAQYPKLFFHVDHVQGIGKVPLQLAKGIDLCTISAHKFHGVKGTGILYIRDGVKLAPLFSGGGQEYGQRAGTEHVPGIAAMAKALRLTYERSEQSISKLHRLKASLLTKLQQIDGIVVNTPAQNAAPHIVNFSVLYVKPEVLIHSLAEKDIFVSTKSACSSKDADASRILMEMGVGLDRATSAIRISMSDQNSQEDIDTFITELLYILPKLKTVMG